MFFFLTKNNICVLSKFSLCVAIIIYVKDVHLNAKITKDMYSGLGNPNLHRV